MVLAYLFLLRASATLAARWPRRLRAAGDAGQTTAEYGLVLLAAAAIAMALIAWATRTDAIGGLFDDIVKKLTDNI